MITISEVKDKDIEKTDLFKKREWKYFDKEIGYERGNEEKYEFVAKEDNEIVGYINLKILGGAAYLSQLLVKKSLRGKGIGDLLIKKFEEVAKEKNCHETYLETSEKHTEALKFYKKHHYKIIATLKNHKFHFTWFYLAKEVKK